MSNEARDRVIIVCKYARARVCVCKTAKMVIVDLEKDLSDGLRLIGLIEVLSGKKFSKYNKKPTFRTQKFENVTQSLRFLEDKEGIKIVNIGTQQIDTLSRFLK